VSNSVAVRFDQAGYHHTSATLHHHASEAAFGSGDHEKAAREAQLAQSHALKAVYADLVAHGKRADTAGDA
jgi:HEPN domain-containing protein